MASNSVKAALSVACMLLFGSANTILLKVQLTQKSVGLEGQLKTFQKPWFMTLTMFSSMVLSLLFVAAQNMRRSKDMLNQSLVDTTDSAPADSAQKGTSYARKVQLVIIPAMFDLCGIGIALIGLLMIPASIWQILRGAEIIFAEIISVYLLSEKSMGYKWCGVATCVLGIAVVGYASVMGSSDDTGSHSKPANVVALGIGLVLFSQIIQAGQMVGEEYFMKEMNLEAMEVVGYEGMWGLLAMVIVVLPAVYLLPGGDVGSQENTIDSFDMLYHSNGLFCAWILLFGSCLIYNLSGIMITQYLTAVHRVICEAMRTLVVWICAIFVYYCVDAQSGFGEQLTPYSKYEALGFGIVFIGQLLYGAILKVPGLEYPPPEKEDVPQAAMSPSAMKSPLYRLASSRADVTAEDMSNL